MNNAGFNGGQSGKQKIEECLITSALTLGGPVIEPRIEPRRSISSKLDCFGIKNL